MSLTTLDKELLEKHERQQQRFGPLAGPDQPYWTCGWVRLLEPHTFHYMCQYPGADVHTTCEPQQVHLSTNGYWCRANFVGIITARGYYGGPLGIEGVHTWRPYTYEVSDLLDGDERAVKYLGERFEVVLYKDSLRVLMRESRLALP